MITVVIDGFEKTAPYDDDAYLRASNRLVEAIHDVADAGAEAGLIAEDVKNALEDM